ncbi:MAG: hypothetical protein AB1898_04240 [Acidobacteriota bacterium]
MKQVRHQLEIKTICLKVGFLIVFLLDVGLGRAAPERNDDYLTFEEVERLRDAQDPPERIKLLVRFLELRLDKAKALKDGPAAAVSDKTQEPTQKDKQPSQEDSHKSLGDLLEEYLQCLDELGMNLENYSDFAIEPKPYIKSLKGLDEALSKQKAWLDQITPAASRSERVVLKDIEDALKEIQSDLQSEIARSEHQLKLMKESTKRKRNPEK